MSASVNSGFLILYSVLHVQNKPLSFRLFSHPSLLFLNRVLSSSSISAVIGHFTLSNKAKTIYCVNTHTHTPHPITLRRFTKSTLNLKEFDDGTERSQNNDASRAAELTLASMFELEKHIVRHSSRDLLYLDVW